MLVAISNGVHMIEIRQELALRAALSPHPLSVRAWRDLRESTTIEELDHSVTRVLPSVYKNLKNDLVEQDLLKLRGSARHTWAKNTEFLRQLEPLIMELEKNSINYRVLKGGAINLLANTPDFRIMGDIDLLVSKLDLGKVHDALDRAGFTPKFAITCPHQNNSRRKLESSFINKKSLEIDLHLAEERSEAALFRRMLRLPPQIVKRRSVEIKLPTIEMLIIHAMVHGLLEVDSEDRAQMLLDVEHLIKNADQEILRRELVRLNFATTFDAYCGLRRQVMGELDSHLVESIKVQGRSPLNPAKVLRPVFFVATTLVRAIRFRAPRLRDSLRIWNNHNGNRVLYLLWLYSGLARPIEFVATTKLSGFLSKDYPNRELSQVAHWTNDWRFRVTNESIQERKVIVLESRAFRDQSFLIFSNGRLVAVTEQVESGKYRLLIRDPALSNEISIRLPFSACRHCARALSDLKISDVT